MDANTQFWIGVIKDLIIGILTAVPTLILAIAAIKGLNQWKEQLKGKTSFEIAYNLLLCLEKLKSAIGGYRGIRARFADMHEDLKKEFAEEKKGNRNKSPLMHLFYEAYDGRDWRKFEKLYSEYREYELKGSPIWGEKFEIACIGVDLEFTFFSSYRNNVLFEVSEELILSESRQSQFNEIFPPVSFPSPKEDKFGSELSERIENLEKIVRPYSFEPPKGFTKKKSKVKQKKN